MDIAVLSMNESNRKFAQRFSKVTVASLSPAYFELAFHDTLKQNKKASVQKRFFLKHSSVDTMGKRIVYTLRQSSMLIKK